MLCLSIFALNKVSETLIIVKVRDKRFIAAHLGGPLSLDNHRLLMGWAIACAEHAVSLAESEVLDQRLIDALQVAKEWKDGTVKTGVAMKVARQTHSIARTISDPLLRSIARAIGQGVGTAHASDHSVGAALYALKAANYAGKSVYEELAWQDEQMENLPTQIKQLLKESRSLKQQSFKDLRDL